MSFLEGNGTPSMVERVHDLPADRPRRAGHAGGAQGDHRTRARSRANTTRRSIRNRPSRCCRSVSTQGPRTGAARGTAQGAAAEPAGGHDGRHRRHARRPLRHQPPRGQRAVDRPGVAREVTRSVTNRVIGEVAGRHRQVDRRLHGRLLGRAIVRGTLGAFCGGRQRSINGMFYDPVAGDVIDLVGGQADIAAKSVRAIGDPAKRFAEDRLRMLRAVRFAAVLITRSIKQPGTRLWPVLLESIRSVQNESAKN